MRELGKRPDRGFNCEAVLSDSGHKIKRVATLPSVLVIVSNVAVMVEDTV